jgi:hypothetical protein
MYQRNSSMSESSRTGQQLGPLLTFLSDYNPTIEDAYRCQRLIDGEAVQLDILDTAGQGTYQLLNPQWSH